MPRPYGSYAKELETLEKPSMVHYADLSGRTFGSATRIDVSVGEPIIVFPPRGARVLMLEANGLRVGQWVIAN